MTKLLLVLAGTTGFEFEFVKLSYKVCIFAKLFKVIETCLEIC